MSYPQFDQAACDSLADCVHEIEKATDAELVIVVRARSGRYAETDYLFGALLALVGLLFLLFSPIQFHQAWVAIDVVLLFLIGSFVSSRSSVIRRLLTLEKSRQERVRTAAAAMFYEAGIANTAAELGVLVYLSLLEGRVELIADRGVLKVVPASGWNEIAFELHESGKQRNPEAFMAALKNLGILLAKCVPATGLNPDELPNRPRVELR